MKNVQEWLNDKPMTLGLASLEWIYIAPDIYKYLQVLSERKSKIKEKFPLPPINEWIEMYENPSVIPMIIGLLINANQLMGMLDRVRVPNDKDAHIMEIKKQELMTPTELKDHEENKDMQDNFWLKISKMRLDSMKNELAGNGRKGEVKLKRVADEKCDTWLRFRTTP